MNQRQLIINEFIQFKNHVNRANKLKNQATTLDFVIIVNVNSRRELFGKIEGGQQILICQEFGVRLWESLFFSEYPRFSLFLISVLKEYDRIKYVEKMSFNTYFYKEYNDLLGFK